MFKELNTLESPRRRKIRIAFYRFLVPIAKVLCRFWHGARVKLFYADAQETPKADGAVIVCNHVCLLDSVMLAQAFPHNRLRFLSLAENGQSCIYGKIVRELGTIFVGNTLLDSKKMLIVEKDAIKKGDAVTIFPEGKLRAYAHDLANFEPGAFELSALLNAPVIPVALAQTDDFSFSKLFGKKSFEVRIGKTIYPKKDATRKKNADYLLHAAREQMQEMLH